MQISKIDNTNFTSRNATICFADYVPKTFEKYNGEYRNYFRRILFGGRNGDFYFEKDSRKHFPFQSLITDRILTPNAINKFAKIRPELFLKKNDNAAFNS